VSIVGSISGTPTRLARVLVVDDSAVVRAILTRLLEQEEGIQVVGTAADAYRARDKIIALEPDVLTLDVEMPRMDGITFLRQLMLYHPMPVIVLSSLTAQGAKTAIEALEAGAIDVVCKPSSPEAMDHLCADLAARIKAAARARIVAYPPVSAGHKLLTAKTPAAGTESIVVAIGASTGGVQALTHILTRFPADAPPTVIVQHMPAHFTHSFAERLDSLCAVEVKEAADGDELVPGRVLLAPGGYQMLLHRAGGKYSVQVHDGPAVQHQKPSVEVLFQSVAKHAGAQAVGALLTGMGVDGARGLLAMRQAGARTIAQDETTSAVFGMPAEALRCGGAERPVPLERIAQTLLSLAQRAAPC
jgi:two-component system chemotaxis response regulator CheB